MVMRSGRKRVVVRKVIGKGLRSLQVKLLGEVKVKHGRRVSLTSPNDILKESVNTTSVDIDLDNSKAG